MTYTSKSALKLQRLSESLLKKAKEKPAPVDKKTDLDALYQVIPYHNWRYYVKDEPLITDFEYDQLFAWLRRLEKAHPEWASPDSPSVRVASGRSNLLPAVRHKAPMLSLENTYRTDTLANWMQKTGGKWFCVEPKFDGAGISLLYKNDGLVRGATRGDGVTGEDVTAAIRQMAAIPVAIPWSRYGIATIEVRGEVLMSKKHFHSYNEERFAHGLPLMANPRNAAAGALRLLHPAVSQHKLTAVLYQVSYYTLLKGHTAPAALQTQSGTLDLLTHLGFPTPSAQKKVSRSPAVIIRYCQDSESKRDRFPYETDGMVVKVNGCSEQRALGMTSHHPRWALAYKFSPRQANSKLREVSFSVGRTGAVTPVAKIDPVAIGGVTIASVSLFNEKQVKEKDIRIGDTVLVERAGDVIPYIVKPVKEDRNGRETPIRFPAKCPVCGGALQHPPGEAIWYCMNMNCKAQVLGHVEHFAGKDAMDIDGLGSAHIRALYDEGLINGISSLFTLDFRRLARLPRWGKKSAANLREAIDKARHQPLYRLIYGLGIRYVGITTAKVLAANIRNLMELTVTSPATLTAIKDIGPAAAESICRFFSSKSNISMLRELERLGVNTAAEKNIRVARHSLKGMTFLFTGTLSELPRRVATEMVQSHGGKVLNSVSHRLNYLVVGRKPGHKLEKSRKSGQVKLLTENEFMKMMKS